MILFLFSIFNMKKKIIFNCQPSHFSPRSAVPVVWNLYYLIGLSQSFLTNRTQVLCIGNILPQGIKMGVPLFSI